MENRMTEQLFWMTFTLSKVGGRSLRLDSLPIWPYYVFAMFPGQRPSLKIDGKAISAGDLVYVILSLAGTTSLFQALLMVGIWCWIRTLSRKLACLDELWRNCAHPTLPNPYKEIEDYDSRSCADGGWSACAMERVLPSRFRTAAMCWATLPKPSNVLL